MIEEYLAELEAHAHIETVVDAMRSKKPTILAIVNNHEHGTAPAYIQGDVMEICVLLELLISGLQEELTPKDRKILNIRLLKQLIRRD